jgi:hypothetical protein
MPAIETLDLGQVELYYDTVLDHFTLFFFGSERLLSWREDGHYKFVIVDPADNSVAGVEYTHFMKAVVLKNPKLLDSLPFATVISGDSKVTAIQSLSPEQRQQIRSHLISMLRSLVEWREDGIVDSVTSDKCAFRQLTV